MEEKLVQIKKTIVSLLVTTGKGLPLTMLNTDYRNVEFENIPFSEYKCYSLEEFIASFLNDSVILRRVNGQIMCFPVISSDLDRISQLVQKTKKTVKNKVNPIGSVSRFSKYRNAKPKYKPTIYRLPLHSQNHQAVSHSSKSASTIRFNSPTNFNNNRISNNKSNNFSENNYYGTNLTANKYSGNVIPLLDKNLLVNTSTKTFGSSKNNQRILSTNNNNNNDDTVKKYNSETNIISEQLNHLEINHKESLPLNQRSIKRPAIRKYCAPPLRHSLSSNESQKIHAEVVTSVGKVYIKSDEKFDENTPINSEQSFNFSSRPRIDFANEVSNNYAFSGAEPNSGNNQKKLPEKTAEKLHSKLDARNIINARIKANLKQQNMSDGLMLKDSTQILNEKLMFQDSLQNLDGKLMLKDSTQKMNDKITFPDSMQNRVGKLMFKDPVQKMDSKLMFKDSMLKMASKMMLQDTAQKLVQDPTRDETLLSSDVSKLNDIELLLKKKKEMTEKKQTVVVTTECFIDTTSPAPYYRQTSLKSRGRGRQMLTSHEENKDTMPVYENVKLDTRVRYSKEELYQIRNKNIISPSKFALNNIEQFLLKNSLLIDIDTEYLQNKQISQPSTPVTTVKCIFNGKETSELSLCDSHGQVKPNDVVIVLSTSSTSLSCKLIPERCKRCIKSISNHMTFLYNSQPHENIEKLLSNEMYAVQIEDGWHRGTLLSINSNSLNDDVLIKLVDWAIVKSVPRVSIKKLPLYLQQIPIAFTTSNLFFAKMQPTSGIINAFKEFTSSKSFLFYPFSSTECILLNPHTFVALHNSLIENILENKDQICS